MAHKSKIFDKVPVRVPNKSGFDLSHSNILSLKCGTLVPVFTKFMLPNDSISVGLASRFNMPPLATDFYGNVEIRYESFFVPMRVLYGGWQSVVTHGKDSSYPSDMNPTKWCPKVNMTREPYVPTTFAGDKSLISRTECGPGSLADYLGMKIDVDPQDDGTETTLTPVNILPFLAYHKIWEDWYRQSQLQRPAFQRYDYQHTGVPQNYPYLASNAPFISPNSELQSYFRANLADNKRITELRQRCWDNDYFTSATTEPQAGEEMKLSFDVVDGEGSFSIRSLRAANAAQQWLERNNIAGERYSDQINARFGIRPSDAVTNRSIYLNSYRQEVYSRSIFKTSSDTAAGSLNPFDSVGSKYGSASSQGSSSLIDDFTASEHGFIMIMASIVPTRNYASGVHRMFSYDTITDMPDALLQGVGDQEIWQSELTGGKQQIGSESGSFGYAQRFAEHKFMPDECHGLLRDGQSLEAFALQQSFFPDESVILSSSFVEIPTDYMDNVTAVRGEVSNYGGWLEIGFKASLASTLSPYTMPTLGDPHDTHIELIDKNGQYPLK